MPIRLPVGRPFLLACLLIAAPTEAQGQRYGVRGYGVPAAGWWHGGARYGYRAYAGGYPGYYSPYYGYPRYYFPIGPVIPRYVYAPPPPVVYVLPPPPPPVQQCPDGSTIPAGAYCPELSAPAPAPAIPPPAPAVPPPTPERG